jgi:hypothetical protein
MRKKVFAFYRPILSVPQDEEFAQANLWKKSWEMHGWECVMLNLSHVSVSPWCNSIMSRIMGLRQFNSGIPNECLDRMVARFVRWCGLQSGSGNWITDYDVLNLGFTPEMAEKIEKDTDVAVPKDSKAWIVFATPQAASEACRTFVFGEMFLPPTWSDTMDEADILKIKKDYFVGLPLVHVNDAKLNESKSSAMTRILNDFLKPAPVKVEKKKSNRKAK